MDDWGHLPDNQLNDWIARIRSGERGQEIDGISRVILMDFSMRYRHRMPQSQIAVGWIVEALGKILDDEDPLASLALAKKGKGRPANTDRDIHIALWVKATEHLGYSRAEAILLASDAFCLEESGVRAIVNRRVEWVTEDAETLALYLQGREPPLPKPAGEK